MRRVFGDPSSTEQVGELVRLHVRRIAAEARVDHRSLTMEVSSHPATMDTVIRLVRWVVVLPEYPEAITYEEVTGPRVFVHKALTEGDITQIPAGWWDAVKLRFAPRWFLKRYPVRYLPWAEITDRVETRRVRREAMLCFPEFQSSAWDSTMGPASAVWLREGEQARV